MLFSTKRNNSDKHPLVALVISNCTGGNSYLYLYSYPPFAGGLCIYN